MSDRRHLFSGKRKYIIGLIILSFISLICGAFSIGGSDDFDIARREVLLRRIGHELLLQSGDSTSLVLPVKKISENEYQIRFENEFSFQPDLLVNTTRRLLAEDPLTGDYVVNVLHQNNLTVAYGYAISKDKKEDIVACIGRKQPQARYIINFKFNPARINIAKKGYLLIGLPLLAFVGFLFLRKAKPGKPLTEDNGSNTFTLGSAVFDANNRKLTINGSEIALTRTEARVLLIFASSPNETIDRNRLQKEIWEDEGVIVGRSLDMFISKLRKKLELDPKLKIIVVRGKGYRLEIGSKETL